MALSLSTALILQNNEIRCFAMGPFPNGKYGSVAYLMEDNNAINSVMSIQYGAYDTCKKAIDELDNIIEIVRDLELPSQEEKLEKLMTDS